MQANRYILIADSGSTKTDWALIGQEAEPLRVQTAGINPVVMDDEVILRSVEEAAASLHIGSESNHVGKGQEHVENGQKIEVHFYGAGIATPELRTRVADIINKVYGNINNVYGVVQTEVESDMLGAARALCQREAGIACILGTGSNSCLWDGEHIVSNTPPLGYILGDEGSGAYLGKRLLGDVLKGLLPKEVRDAFFCETGTTYPQIIERVYRQPQPNKWMAGLALFLQNHIDEPSLQEIVREAFRAFVRRNIVQYGRRDLPLHFTGGIASQYADLLRESVEAEGYKMGTVVSRPIEGLIRYHNIR